MVYYFIHYNRTVKTIRLLASLSAMPPPMLRLISSTSVSTVAGLPPILTKPPISNQSLSINPSEENRQKVLRLISRRDAAFLSLISLFPSLLHTPHASAFSIGICAQFSLCIIFLFIDFLFLLLTAVWVSVAVRSRTQGLA